MIEFITQLFSTFFEFLTGVLPQSPFQDLTLNSAVTQWLGWLNWVVPIGDMLNFLTICISIYVGAKIAITVFNLTARTAEKVTGA